MRYSLVNPHAYVESNLSPGFMNMLEGCRHSTRVQQLVYASSSSVYGGNTHMPFSEHHSVDHPVSMYAATKKANELMAHTYSHLFGLPTTGLALLHRLRARGDGRTWRCSCSRRRSSKASPSRCSTTATCSVTSPTSTTSSKVWSASPTACGSTADDALPARRHLTPATSNVPYRVFNIGNHNPVPLMEFIGCIERALGREAEKQLLPLQDGDVPATYADVDALAAWVGFSPATSIETGVQRFVEWYRAYYRA